LFILTWKIALYILCIPLILLHFIFAVLYFLCEYFLKFLSGILLSGAFLVAIVQLVQKYGQHKDIIFNWEWIIILGVPGAIIYFISSYAEDFSDFTLEDIMDFFEERSRDFQDYIYDIGFVPLFREKRKYYSDTPEIKVIEEPSEPREIYVEPEKTIPQKPEILPPTKQELGKIGEKIVEEILTKLPSEYSFLSNRIFNVPHYKNQKTDTTEIDHILFSKYGIFVIETKNWAGTLEIIEGYHPWILNEYSKPSPLKQNYGHIKTLMGLFQLPKEKFISIIVFTNTEMEKFSKYTPSEREHIIFSYQLEDVILSYTEPIFTDEQIEFYEAETINISTENAEKRAEHIQNLEKVFKTGVSMFKKIKRFLAVITTTLLLFSMSIFPVSAKDFTDEDVRKWYNLWIDFAYDTNVGAYLKWGDHNYTTKETPEFAYFFPYFLEFMQTHDINSYVPRGDQDLEEMVFDEFENSFEALDKQFDVPIPLMGSGIPSYKDENKEFIESCLFVSEEPSTGRVYGYVYNGTNWDLVDSKTQAVVWALPAYTTDPFEDWALAEGYSFKEEENKPPTANNGLGDDPMSGVTLPPPMEVESDEDTPEKSSAEKPSKSTEKENTKTDKNDNDKDKSDDEENSSNLLVIILAIVGGVVVVGGLVAFISSKKKK
jgi:hypothetical protein